MFLFGWSVALSVGTIISGFQSQALAGVGLFLTGYRKSFAPGSPVADCEERQADLAQRLGATVYRRFDEPGVTHVMAGKSNTNNMLALKWVLWHFMLHTLYIEAFFSLSCRDACLLVVRAALTGMLELCIVMHSFLCILRW